jgi:uncharacterized protein (DUF169 family)
MANAPWNELADRLVSALHLSTPPVAIAFSDAPPGGLAPFDAPMSEPSADGRRGRVSASCVFWVHGAEDTFVTAPEDHGNCSVGRVTHGLATPGEVAGNDDVATLVGSGWVGAEDLARLPSVSGNPRAISYAPLAEVPAAVDPDVVLLRLNGRQMMVVSDAVPAMTISGKPQCHIVAVAKERHQPAASVGCALSRARTGMTPDEMSCALPAGSLASIVEAIERAADTDGDVARYAASDARRFTG